MPMVSPRACTMQSGKASDGAGATGMAVHMDLMDLGGNLRGYPKCLPAT